MPAALAAMTGGSTDQVAGAISAVSPGVEPGDVGSVLRETVWDALPYLGIDAAADFRYRDPPDLWDWARQADDGRWLVCVIRDPNDHVIALAKRGDDIAAMDWTRPLPAGAATTAEEMQRLGHREDGQCRVRWAWPIVSRSVPTSEHSRKGRANMPVVVFQALPSMDRTVDREAIEEGSRLCGARPIG